MEYIGRLLELLSPQNDPSGDPLGEIESQQQQQQQQPLDRTQSDLAFVKECNMYCISNFGHSVARDTDLLLGAARLNDKAWGFPSTHPLAKAMQAHENRHNDLDFPVHGYVKLQKRYGKCLVVYANEIVERCVEAVCDKFEQHTEIPLMKTNEHMGRNI
jgi:hypothetical protein